MNDLIKLYKMGLKIIKNPENSCNDDVVKLYSIRDDILANWCIFSEIEKQEIKQLDQQLIHQVSDNWGYDFHEVAENNNFPKEIHWWYWLSIEPEVKKYAEAA